MHPVPLDLLGSYKALNSPKFLGPSQAPISPFRPACLPNPRFPYRPAEPLPDGVDLVGELYTCRQLVYISGAQGGPVAC